MGLKNNECPNCGANMKYNARHRRYECEYCHSLFNDTKESNSRDSRVELSPDELEMMKPTSNNKVSRSSNDKTGAIIVAIVIIFFGIPTILPIIFSIFSLIFMGF